MNEFNTEVMHQQDSFSRHLAKTFIWMLFGLALSAAVAWYVYDSLLWIDIALAFSGYGSFLLLVAQIVLVLFLGKAVRSWSMPVTAVIFFGYATLTGVNLSVLPAVYDMTSIYLSLGLAAIMFGCMATIGLTTRIDLTQFSTLFVVGLITMLLLTLVGIFMDLGVFEMAINYLGIGLFLGIVAWDMQKIRAWYDQAVLEDDQVFMSKLAIYGALEFYLDFINLFLRILRIIGRRND